jgi:peptide chain release factor subunit 1
MEMETTTETPSLAQTLDRLARMEPVPFPLVSLYLNAQPDNRGKDNYAAFLRKELRGRIDDFELRSAERESFEKDVEAIERWLATEVRPSANGIAIFASSGADFFEALQLDAPIENHRVTVGDRPQLSPLARIVDRFPRHAVLVADGNAAHIYVFGRGRTIDREDVSNPKMSRTDAGGWSQMRYQRHVENLQLHHAKEVAEELRKIVAEDRAEYVFLAGDEVIIPVLRNELAKELEKKVVGVLRLEIRTPEDEVREAAAEALAAHMATEEKERIERITGEWRAGGLGVAGEEAVLEALRNGQVDEVVVSSALDSRNGESNPVTDEIVQRALATRATVRFVDDPELLADANGILASLRYKPGAPPRDNSPVERKAEV